MVNETHQKMFKVHYDCFVCPRVFSKGDLVQVYDQDWEKLGVGKFDFLWNGPYVVKCELQKEVYELKYNDGNTLAEPQNGLYLKKYFA